MPSYISIGIGGLPPRAKSGGPNYNPKKKKIYKLINFNNNY